MKTRIELSCTEDHITESLFEVRKIIDATDLLSVELKVFHDRNRSVVEGHTWITVTNKSNPTELQQIYELKKKIGDLCDELDKRKGSDTKTE
jgi:hypothetical protein